MGRPDPSDFSRVGKEARGRAAQMGLSNAEVARRAHVDPATVGNFFNGTSWPRRSKLSKIEEVLGLEPGALTAAAEGAEITTVEVVEPQTLTVPVPDSVPLADLSEPQLDYLRSAATLGVMRAFSEIEVQQLRANSPDA